MFIIITHQGLQNLRKLELEKRNGYSQDEINFLQNIREQKIHRAEKIDSPNKWFAIKLLAEKRDIVTFE